MPTIRDVAKRAGVAPITVSRVMNNQGYVSDDTRAKVEAAVAELNYIPNALGSSLRSRRTGTLALVLSDITNPFWTTVARGVEDAANASGHHIIVGNTDESPAKQQEYLMFLLKKQVDGFLLVPAESTAPPLELLQKHEVPFVVLDRKVPFAADTVRCDSEAGAYALTQHLTNLGHQHIAIITGPQHVSTATDRVQGYLRALKDAGIEDKQQIYWGEYIQETGYTLTKQLLNQTPHPTAIFAANNFIVIGVMRALRKAGLQVPSDISVVTFDELPPTLTIDPFFTVAVQPAYEMGQKATERLLSRLAGYSADTPQDIILSAELIIRASSSRPPGI